MKVNSGTYLLFFYHSGFTGQRAVGSWWIVVVRAPNYLLQIHFKGIKPAANNL